MTYKELSKYHENDIFIFRRGKDVTINTQKILVDWYNRIPKSKRFKIKYVQRIPLTLRIFNLFGYVSGDLPQLIIQFGDTNSIFHAALVRSAKRYAENKCTITYGICAYRIEEHKNVRETSMEQVKYVDQVQKFVRTYVEKECMDVHTLLKEFLKKPF